eukprot:2509347-Pleurochrysis_carterae.AAC.1
MDPPIRGHMHRQRPATRRNPIGFRRLTSAATRPTRCCARGRAAQVMGIKLTFYLTNGAACSCVPTSRMPRTLTYSLMEIL